MDWGNAITYLGSTTLKERAVQFGIKDEDRLKHFCVLGRNDSGRADLVAQMALQDIERGVGTMVLDASGKVAPLLIERIDPSLSDQIIYLDPAVAEYPYAWNPLDDIRALPEEKQKEAVVTMLVSLYSLERSAFVAYVADLLLHREETTLITPHTLVTDEKAREVFFKEDSDEKKQFEEKLDAEPSIKEVFEEAGRYIGKDTLIRNLLGQPKSKFHLKDIQEGKILIVDFSHMRIFPTRMTPLVRTFVNIARMNGDMQKYTTSLFLHDCLRYLGESEIESLFSAKSIAVTVADTIVQESDKERREFAISRCGSIASFTTHPADKDVIERAFYPYAEPEELNRLSKGELVVALTIDAVRARPFFAKALPLPEKKHIAYQDLVVEARERYTVSRTTVDALFKKQKGEKEPPRKRGSGGGGFQDAFKSIMENRAKKMPIKDLAPGEKGAQQTTKKGTKKTASSADTQVDGAQTTDKKEISEDTLRSLLYVRPLPS